jgi:hypothetical protein
MQPALGVEAQQAIMALSARQDELEKEIKS